MGLEHEFKWSARTTKDFDAFLSAVPDAVFAENAGIYDVYYDNKDKYYSSQKMSCRIRRQNGAYILTFKSDTKIVNGLARREEKNINLKAKNLPDAVKESAKYLPAKGIKKIFSIKNKRKNYALKNDFEAEVSFDDCVIKAGKKTARMFEIEMEFKHGDEKKFNNFAKNLTKKTGLKFAEVSKVKTAISLLRS
ncbi:inorganic triphosphatase YgiF [Elusimicrobium posterum]|uniref:CYTH domain-containing protein n=1 Tax=Elusimicrobium posterum TaxID=3116653 RepID=UPI003C72252C